MFRALSEDGGLNYPFKLECNLDVTKMVDYIIDLGPEGGEAGGMVVVTGSPEEIIKNKRSYTAKFLREKLIND